MPDSLLGNPEHWQRRAEEARSIADPESRGMMASYHRRLRAAGGARRAAGKKAENVKLMQYR
jgi:hypothetical protein